MSDYTYPSIFFSYFLFVLMAVGAVVFFFRSLKDGYMGSNSEEPKYRMLEDDPSETDFESNGAHTPRRS
jgi:hypothetical protein